MEINPDDDKQADQIIKALATNPKDLNHDPVYETLIRLIKDETIFLDLAIKRWKTEKKI